MLLGSDQCYGTARRHIRRVITSPKRRRRWLTVSTTASVPGTEPNVTAAVTTYERYEQTERAVRSVLRQTYESIELVIVEDGSDSGIADWIDSEDIECRYVRHDSNRGLAAARNTAIDTSTADYIAFLDDDDEWKPRRIERTVHRLRSIPEDRLSTFGVVYCGTERRRNGQVLSIGHPENEGNLKEAIMDKGASTLPSSCLFSKEALEAVGGYDESLPSSIDHDIWMALAAGGYDAYTVDEPLVVTHDPFEDSMETDTVSRIRGVRRYVEKWTPTYQEWFGAREGQRYASRYFVRVVSRLAAVKLVSGQVDDARLALNAIREENGGTWYSYRVLVAELLEATMKRYFPAWSVRFASELTSRLGVR